MPVSVSTRHIEPLLPISAPPAAPSTPPITTRRGTPAGGNAFGVGRRITQFAPPSLTIAPVLEGLVVATTVYTQSHAKPPIGIGHRVVRFASPTVTHAPLVVTNRVFHPPASRTPQRRVFRPQTARPVLVRALPAEAHIWLQATARIGERRLRDNVAPPHLAKPALKPAGPKATIRLQGRQRVLLRPTVPHPHLAPPIVLPPVLVPRQLGIPTVTVVLILRLAGLTHTRETSIPTVTPLILSPLVHTRGIGAPQLSARIGPLGLAHTRVLPTPSVNSRTLGPSGISRA